ncbi:MAG: hypothetical protein DMG83_27635 [Acidobacteria bacterium]|nr:MAG: hypothetical protein DMG83_27635 [Acidobacteriota bacterium]
MGRLALPLFKCRRGGPWSQCREVRPKARVSTAQLMRFMGGCEQTETFLRLFLIPGVHHGRGGPGLTESDALTALEKWIERGPPPKLIACHRDKDVIERCRPVFPYPDVGSLFRQTRSEGGREFRALRLLPALSSFCGSRSMRLQSGSYRKSTRPSIGSSPTSGLLIFTPVS